MTAFYPVILAGGSGERFWPLSRRAKPKQFLSLDESGRSLLQHTADRLSAVGGGIENLFVVTTASYRSHVLDQIPDLAIENLLVEPVARDTAPAILYAALRLAQLDPDGVMGVFPSDHHIEETAAFASVLARARYAAEKYGSLATLGITPTYPATGYGYIERGSVVEAGDSATPPVLAVTRFTEKPDRDTAHAFVSSGRYSWNSGIFVWSVRAVLSAFEHHQPHLYKTLRDAVIRRDLLERAFGEVEKISIDYAIMERARNVHVVPAHFGWDDLGDWSALERMLRGSGAHVIGHHVGSDTDAIIYVTRGNDLLATIGLDDVIVVRSEEVTLVVHKDRTQDIRKVVEQLEAHPELHKFV